MKIGDKIIFGIPYFESKIINTGIITKIKTNSLLIFYSITYKNKQYNKTTEIPKYYIIE